MGVEADQKVFRNYKEGILDSEECGTLVNHYAVVVGYGTYETKEYYILRNSWGTDWGEAGYAKIAIVDGDGICGI